MVRASGLRRAKSTSVALLSILAIASGFTGPVLGAGRPVAAAPAGNARSIEALTASTAARIAAREAGWDLRAAAPARAVGSDGRVVLTTQTARRPAVARANVHPGLGPSANALAYKGRNHVWIPSLGISDAVLPYACSRTRDPADYMYRWGCAGHNNVYILGHARSVMKPLHDLYVSGGLRKGLVALYADADGRIRAYQVTEWRVVLPTEIAWQIAAQPVPSMTLQTCVGKNDRYRLNVRLVEMR